MKKASYNILPATEDILKTVGEQIKLARLRRNLSVELVSERAGISRASLWNVERGSPSVAIGIYAAVLHALNNMDKDLLLIAKDDEMGRKMQDLKMRVGLIDENNPDLAISIHQNSYTDPEVYGPQVFYHSKSEEGGVAARCVQEALNAGLAIEKPRECKDNVSYYLLSNTKSPLIISECAFLSNEEDEAKLNDEEYIESVIRCLVEGICNYLECR